MKKVRGFPSYLVTRDGKVWSDLKGGFLIPAYNIAGYLRVKLYKGVGEYKWKMIHRLVAIAYKRNPKNKPQVNHLDEDIHNNNDWNLGWATASENKLHSINLRNKRAKENVPF